MMTKANDGIVKLRCGECGTPFAHLQNGAIVIKSRHHGKEHVNIVAVNALVEMVHLKEKENVKIPMGEDEEVTMRKQGLFDALLSCDHIMVADDTPRFHHDPNDIPSDMVVVSVNAWSEKYQQYFWTELLLDKRLVLDKAVSLVDFVLAHVEKVKEEGPQS